MNFRKFKTIYIIDHPIRDLPAYSWWCSIKANDSFEKYMVSTSEISMDAIRAIKPDAIIWNCARPQNAFLIRFAFMKGIKNIIHDTEGILYKDDEYLSSLDKITFQCIHSIWCWGNEQKRIINKIALKNCQRELAIDIGSIRYEYYKNLGLKKINKNKILVNTNFPVIAPRYAALKNEFNTWVNIEKKLNKFQFIQKCIELSAMRESVLNFINNLIENQEFPPELITLRIHPFESIKYYESIKNLGINISNNKDIYDDISEAMIIAQCGCQTVLDGLIQKVPSILIEPSYENIWSNISSKVDVESLKKIINDKNEYKNFKEKFFNKSSNEISPYISNIAENLNTNLLFKNLKEKKIFKIHNFLIVGIMVLSTKSFLSLKKFLKRIIHKKSKSNAKLTNEKIEKFLKNKNIKFKKYKSKYIYF